MKANVSRRKFLQATGFLSLTFGIPLESALSQSSTRLPGDLNTTRMLRAWLRIGADNQVTLLVGKVELGQGILTAVQQVCADELDVDMTQIQVISGDTALVPNEGVTAGSFSMPNCATAVRHASAEVRALLLALAAERWQVPVDRGLGLWAVGVSEALTPVVNGCSLPLSEMSSASSVCSSAFS